MRQPDLEYKTLGRMKSDCKEGSRCIDGDDSAYTRPNYERNRFALYLEREPIRFVDFTEQTQLRPAPVHYHAESYGITLES
jgi:hypothetical protein